MPITAKLSRKFYEKLGDEVTNELVAWLNAVDESYRNEFRELFEAHFGRFDERQKALEGRVDERLKALEDRLDERLKALETRFEARMDSKLQSLKSALLFWMFLFWVGTIGILKL